MKNWISLLALLAAFHSCAQTSVRFDQSPAQPELVGVGQVSTGLSERDFAFSPDGSEIFYTLQSPGRLFQTMVYMKKEKNGAWTAPVIAPFAGNFSDLEPAFSMDGKKLFFCSNRPDTGSQVKDFDIWLVEKLDGKWGVPKNLGSPVNTPADEFYPSVTKKGNLYFTSAYPDGVGKEDIYCATWKNGSYQKPVALDSNINSKTYEFNAFVTPDEDYIIFTSYGRKDDKGGGDLYMSSKDASGNWQPARNLAFLNSNKIDYCPFRSFDGKTLFFTSERMSLQQSYMGKPASYAELQKFFNAPGNGGGDIYSVSFEKVVEKTK